MPVLPLPPELSLERKFLWVKAHMLFPDSPSNALTLFARNLVGRELKDAASDNEVTFPVHWIRALAFGPGLSELSELERQRSKAGVTAGLVLSLIFVMQKGNYDRPSINKAARVIEDIAFRKKRQRVAVEHYSDRKEILAAWKLMRDSSHFWASLELMGMSGAIRQVRPGDEAFNIFLRLAAALRKFGCAQHQSNTREKKPLLNPISSLQLPDYIENEAQTFGPAPIPDWIESILKGYKAPRSL